MLEAVLACILTAVFSLLGIALIVNMTFAGIEERKQAKRNEAREQREIEYHEKRMKEFR